MGAYNTTRTGKVMVTDLTAEDYIFAKKCLRNFGDGRRYAVSDIKAKLKDLNIETLKKNNSFRKLVIEDAFRDDGVTPSRERMFVFDKWRLIDMLLDDVQNSGGFKIRGIIK